MEIKMFFFTNALKLIHFEGDNILAERSPTNTTYKWLHSTQ